jgi:hypothetical protein
MAKLVKHKFVSAIPDDADATVVRPSNWNDDHDLTGIAESGTNTDITSMSGITGTIATPTAIQMGNGNSQTLVAGKIWYTPDTGAWNAGMGNGNITQQIGEELFIYGKASAAITDSPLQIVYHTGTVGASGVITFAPTIAGITDENAIIGVATESIALNGFGRATTFGVVRGITTNGTAFGETWADDDVIWYNSATGNPTNIKPSAPNIKFQIGLVIKAGAGGSGSFQVALVQGTALGGTDSNVKLTSTTNGNILTYDGGNGYWKNTDLTAGTGISVGKSANGVLTVTNSSPNTYDPAAVAITGGTINNATIGATTATTGKFTTLEATGTSTLGTASSQYIQVEGGSTAVLLSAQGAGTNIPLALQPKGTGALQAQATTSTTAGGNARGQYAVDWQTSRNGAAQVASSTQSVVGGGFGNTASNVASTVAGGASNVVNQPYGGILSGQSNAVTLNYASVVGGSSNTGSGYYGFVGGGTSNSTTSSSAVTTQSATMNGTTAVTLSGSNANIKVGQFITGTSITFPNTYVAAISGTSLTLSQAASGSSTSTLSFFTPHGVVVGGGNNQATGSYSFIGGGGDAGTAANRNVASGDWSFVGGGTFNVASGIGSVICGGGYDGSSAVTNTASGAGSFIGGGKGNSASTTGSAVLSGFNNNSNGTLATVVGGRYGITRGISGNAIFPSCVAPIAAVQGVSQSALLVLAVQTTDATATALRSDSSAASGTNQVILPNNSAYFFTGEVVSGKTAGGDTKGWSIEGVIKRGANAASTALVGTPTVTSLYADVGAATWVLAVTADTTNGGIRVTFTGQAATTIRTVCQIRTTEMTY